MHIAFVASNVVDVASHDGPNTCVQQGIARGNDMPPTPPMAGRRGNASEAAPATNGCRFDGTLIGNPMLEVISTIIVVL